MLEEEYDKDLVLPSMKEKLSGTPENAANGPGEADNNNSDSRVGMAPELIAVAARNGFVKYHCGNIFWLIVVLFFFV